jgi:membrane protein implicated in regulation of membrane protease activity
MPAIAFQLFSYYGVYAICFWVGLLFTVISGISAGAFDGGGGDGHFDTGHAGDAGHGDAGHVQGSGDAAPQFPAFGPVTICTFITTFGGTGMILSKVPATSSPLVHLPVAAVCGFGGAVAIFLLFSKVFFAMQSSSEVHQAAVVGKKATVITTIPAGGMGEVAYFAGASRCHVQARSVSGQPIANGAEVVVRRITGGTYFVEPANPEPAATANSN